MKRTLKEFLKYYHHLPTQGSSRKNIPSKSYRTVVKRKCLENSFRKIYNSLLNLDLIPQNILKMTKSEMKSYVDSGSPVQHILKLPRILRFPETLGKNLDKILTKSAKKMYDLAKSSRKIPNFFD